MYGMFGSETTECTVIYGVYVQFWPTLHIHANTWHILLKHGGVPSHIHRVGQHLIYTVHVRYVWQGKHRMYGHVRCICTVLANPAQ